MILIGVVEVSIVPDFVVLFVFIFYCSPPPPQIVFVVLDFTLPGIIARFAVTESVVCCLRFFPACFFYRPWG